MPKSWAAAKLKIKRSNLLAVPKVILALMIRRRRDWARASYWMCGFSFALAICCVGILVWFVSHSPYADIKKELDDVRATQAGEKWLIDKYVPDWVKNPVR